MSSNMDSQDQYQKMSSCLESLRMRLEEQISAWDAVDLESWEIKYLVPGHNELKADLACIKKYVDSSQEEIKDLNAQLRLSEKRSMECRAQSNSKMAELKLMQGELKSKNDQASKHGRMLKEMQGRSQKLEMNTKNMLNEQRREKSMARVEAVVYAHCTRLAEPELMPDGLHYKFKSLDADKESDFMGRKYEINQNWEELSNYHGIEMKQYAIPHRPNTRPKRVAPSGEPPFADSESKKRSSITV